MRTSFAMGVLVLVLAAPGAALADGRDPAAAETLYRTAKEAAKKGDWATACAQFAESQRFDPGPGTLLNLADCEEHRGELARAWQHFVQAESELPKGDKRVAFAHGRAAALDKRVPRLIVKLAPGTPEGTVVVKDEQELGAASLGVALPVDAGEHAITTRAAGRLAARVTVNVADGETREVVVTAGARAPTPEGATIAPPPLQPTATSPADADSKRAPAAPGGRGTLGWVLIGAGGVGLATGAVTGFLALSRAGTVKDACGADYLTCNAASVDAARDGKTFATVSTIGFVAGTALAAAGLYFVLTQPRASTRAALQIAPNGMVVSGRF